MPYDKKYIAAGIAAVVVVMIIIIVVVFSGKKVDKPSYWAASCPGYACDPAKALLCGGTPAAPEYVCVDTTDSTWVAPTYKASPDGHYYNTKYGWVGVDDYEKSTGRTVVIGADGKAVSQANK